MASAFWRQNILELLHSKCSAPLHSWSDSPIGCSAPLYYRSGSLIGSAYSFLYINSCFRFNKSLMNLTSLRQHHLQYKYLFRPIIPVSKICEFVPASGQLFLSKIMTILKSLHERHSVIVKTSDWCVGRGIGMGLK